MQLPGGKGVFDSQGCAGCHGEGGGGGSGPALTHISSQYPPAKLTAILKAPTASMKAAGMVPLTLNAADMKESGFLREQPRGKIGGYEQEPCAPRLTQITATRRRFRTALNAARCAPSQIIL